MWYFVILCDIMLYYVILHYIILYYVLLYYFVLCYVILCYIMCVCMLCYFYFIQCYVALYYVMLYCIVWYCIVIYYIVCMYVCLYVCTLCLWGLIVPTSHQLQRDMFSWKSARGIFSAASEKQQPIEPIFCRSDLPNLVVVKHPSFNLLMKPPKFCS